MINFYIHFKPFCKKGIKQAFNSPQITNMKTQFIFLICLSVALTCQSFVHDKWIFLGERTVDRALDRDEIYVTAKDGVFDKIKLEVKRSKVNFHKVVVHYANGSKEEIALRGEIPAGGQTRAIDLEGKKRIIKKVVFYYDTKGLLKKKAKVRLLGHRH